MKTILIVDDDPHIQELLSTLVKAHTDYRTVSAEDGEAALDIVETTAPDLILIDMLMPRIGGIALFYEFRRREQTKDTPVIFMSGTLKDEEFQQEGIDMGAVDYIPKPIALKELLEKMNRILAESDESAS